MADSSFDIVSKVERQEVDNALNQAAKEISQRYDFKGVGASISWSGDQILMAANSEDRVKAVLNVFQSKLISQLSCVPEDILPVRRHVHESLIDKLGGAQRRIETLKPADTGAFHPFQVELDPFPGNVAIHPVPPHAWLC